MSIFDEIEALSKRYWSHEHKRHKVGDEAFERLSESLILISKGIGENEKEVARVALKELWGATLLLNQTLGRETTQLTGAALRITDRISRLIAMSRDQFGESLDPIETQLGNVIRLCKNPNVGIYKGGVVGKLISENPDSIVIAKHPDAMKGLRSIRDEYNPEVQIFALDDLPESSSRSTIILSCWPGPKSMDKLVRASLADRYLIAGYDRELAWAELFFNRVHDFPSKNLITLEDKKALYDGLKVEWPTRPIVHVSHKAQEVGNMVDVMGGSR